MQHGIPKAKNENRAMLGLRKPRHPYSSLREKISTCLDEIFPKIDWIIKMFRLHNQIKVKMGRTLTDLLLIMK